MQPRRIVSFLSIGAIVVLATTMPMVAADAKHRSARHNAASPIDDPIPGHVENGPLRLQLEVLAEGAGLTAPNYGTSAPGHPGVLFVVDQDGPLWAVNTATGAKNMYLDTTSLLVPLFPGDERGFLGVAFHPDFATNGLLYTMTSEIIPGTDGSALNQPNHLATVREWHVAAPAADPLSAAALTPAGTRVVLQVEEPQFNHNGGALFFGTAPADRQNMYITLGDGGCADDQNGQLGLAGEGPCISHEGAGNAQNLGTLLGKILRINPLASGGASYTVPAGNMAAAGARPEIFAFGLRNPFRASSDRADLGGTGQVWTGDVGQNSLEEVDARIVPGGNYGWRVKEGTFQFNPNGFELFGFASDGFVFANTPGQPAGLIDPVGQYDHDDGVAVIGGFVYHGQRIPRLRGSYVFGDFSDGPDSGNGRVFVLDESDNADPNVRNPNVFNLVNGHINLFVLGFGEDAQGELYVLANKPGVPFEEEGFVLKVVKACAPGAVCID